jgi:foldase protein PrsA
MLPNKRNTFTSRGLIFLAVTALCVIILSACGNNKEEPPGKEAGAVAATYQGGQVTLAEFESFKSVIALMDPIFAEMITEMEDHPEVRKSLLEQLITLKILYGKADQETLKEAEPKVKQQSDEYIKALERGFGSKNQLNLHLKEQGISRDDIKTYIERSIVAITHMENQVTDRQLKDQFERSIKNDKHFYDLATVSHILIGFEGRSKEEALQRAEEVEDKLKKGGDFAVLAKEYSDDPGSKDAGGRYVDAELQGWDPQFKKAAAELPLKQISDPIETIWGYHVMKVESRTSRGFTEVKEQIHLVLAENLLLDFISNELPGLIEETNFPQTETQK